MTKTNTIRELFEDTLVDVLKGRVKTDKEGEPILTEDGRAAVERPAAADLSVVRAYLKDQEQPKGAELPKTVVLPVIEADAVVKGQTASSSYKPAIVEGGIRVMVPPHIGVGTRLVINTEDGSYLERAKD